MKKNKKQQSSNGKIAVITALYTGAALITASGVWFAIYSIANSVTVKVLGNNIPGVILALLVAYFGVRAFLSVRKLSNEILEDSSYFSWSNFKRAKPAKSR